jgi:hypothetical protein
VKSLEQEKIVKALEQDVIVKSVEQEIDCGIFGTLGWL